MDSGQSNNSKSSKSREAYAVILIIHCRIGFLITGWPPLSLKPPITSSFESTVPNSSHQFTSTLSKYASLFESTY